MLLRELIGGDPSHTCKLILFDDSTGFGHRVVGGDRVLEHALTNLEEFDQAVSAKIAEGFAEPERSLSRRVFAFDELFWIVASMVLAAKRSLAGYGLSGGSRRNRLTRRSSGTAIGLGCIL